MRSVSFINLEAQADAEPGYSVLKRGIFYCGRMLSAQKGVEFERSEYDDLKKCIRYGSS